MLKPSEVVAPPQPEGTMAGAGVHTPDEETFAALRADPTASSRVFFWIASNARTAAGCELLELC